MDLVNDYLRAVAALLPRTEREDIIAELQEPILARIEAREAELKRALLPDEIETILRSFGHPLVVAARYRSETQQVVGPALYPFWWFIVKIAVTIQAAGAVIVLMVRWLSGMPFGQALGDAISAALTGAMMIVGLVTIGAWIIERFKLRLPHLENWRVRDLRIFEYADVDLGALRERLKSAPVAPVAPRKAARRVVYKRLGTAAEGLAIVAWSTVFALWWAGALKFGVVGDITDLDQLSLRAGPLADIDWNSVKTMLFWPVLALAMVSVISGLAMLAYPRARAVHGMFAVLQGAGTLAVCGWLWTASPLTHAIHVDSLSELAVRVHTAFRDSPPLELSPMIAMVLGFVALGAVSQILKGLWLALSRQRSREPGSNAQLA